MTLAFIQLVSLSVVGLIRFFLVAQMSQAGVASSYYGLFLFCSSIASIIVPFVIGHHIDQGRYREIVLWQMVILGSMALWLLSHPPQSITLLACSFTFIASCVVVAVQLCLKAAVVEGCTTDNFMRGNWLNQVVLALSLVIPAAVHLKFYGDYESTQLFVGMLCIAVMTGFVAKLKLPNMLNVHRLNQQVRPKQMIGVLRQHLSRSDNFWYVLLLLLMSFAIGILESYAMPKIQVQFGGNGLVYALLAVGCLYFIGSFTSLAINKIRFSNSLAVIYIVMVMSFMSILLTTSLTLLLVLCALFFMLHPHIFILIDSRIQHTVKHEVIGTHFSVLRVASFVMLSLGNLTVFMIYRLKESLLT